MHKHRNINFGKPIMNLNKEVKIVGKDRQEKKLKKSKRVESDRDQGLHYPGATSLQSPEEGRDTNGQR